MLRHLATPEVGIAFVDMEAYVTGELLGRTPFPPRRTQKGFGSKSLLGRRSETQSELPMSVRPRFQR